MAAHFFLSYSRQDQPFAVRLAGDLSAAGAAIWMDQENILPSERWDRAVETAVRDCAGIVLVLSPRSAASDHVLDELATALDAGKPVIPILIEACDVPLRLARVQYIDATGDYAATLASCLAAMDQTGHPAPVVGPAVEPATVAASARPFAVSPEIRTALTAALTRFMGPISEHLVDEARRLCGSHDALIDRLAAQIPDGADRAAFSAEARRLGSGVP